MRLRIVWSKTFGQFSLEKSAQLKLQKNMILLMLIIHMDVSMTLRLGQQVRPDEIGRQPRSFRNPLVHSFYKSKKQRSCFR